MCTLGFQGKGYSKAFVENYQDIADSLRVHEVSGDEIKIKVVSGSDSICQPCPNREGEVCATEAKIQMLDSGHSKVLGIKPGDVLTWGEAKSRIAEKMEIENHHEICAPCSWLASGICEEALLKLKKSKKNISLPLLVFLFVLITALVPTSFSYARTKPAPKKVTEKTAEKSNEEPTLSEGRSASIEELKEALKNYHTKKTAALKKSFDLYVAKKYVPSKKLIVPLMNDPTYGDLVRWLISQDNYELTKDAFKQKKYSDALKFSQVAIDVLSVIPNRFPYSSVTKILPREIALEEFMSGNVQCELEKWVLCKAFDESALMRVFGTPEMAYVTPLDLKNYAEACSEETTDICLAWVQRLAQYYPKVTEEFKALSASFPEYTDEVPKPSGYSHSTQNYKSPDLDQTAIDEAIGLYLEGKTRDAIDAFRRFTDDYPHSGSRFRALYWLAQALKKTGKSDEAKVLLAELLKASPLSYYGLLASIETETQPETVLDQTVPLASDSDPFLTPLELFKVHRARALLADKVFPLAALELKEFHSRDGLSSHFLTYLAMLQVQAQSYSVAFPIINELINRGSSGAAPDYFLKMIFPKGELSLVEKYADESKVDPILVMSLTKQESAFNPSATSVSGALGLMQLMPTTAVETVPGQIRMELLSKETNVKVGTTYLAKMLARFQGNLVYSIASYNAGPGAVTRWIHAAPQGRGMLEFIESIPYKETREYVAAIIRNYYWYTKLLNPDAAKSLTLDYFWHNYGPSVTMSATPSPTPTPTPTPRPINTPTPTDPDSSKSEPKAHPSILPTGDTDSSTSGQPNQDAIPTKEPNKE